jgi:hypothetical protein
MACGCKNKKTNTQTTNSSPTPTVLSSTTQVVQETIKKTVEKYYNKN